MGVELFLPTPKESKENLYNFEQSLNEILRGLRDPLVRMIVIKGLRRTGKSSLLRVALNESKYSYILIDMREFDDISPKEFRRELTLVLRRILSGKKRVILDRIRAISFLGVKLDISSRRITYRELLRKINEIALRKNTCFVLAVDEAQEIYRLGFDKYLAFVYDNLRAIKLVLSGSQVGLLNNILNDPEAPLFGRARLEIDVEKLSREQSKEFLEMGFRAYNVTVPEEWVEKAVNTFNGIIGWLNLFGWYVVELKKPEIAFQKTLEEAKRLVSSELRKFLRTRGVAYDRYVLVLKILAESPKRWKEVKDLLWIKLRKKISNNKVSRYLNELRKYGFIKKENGYYRIPDPLLAKTILEEF